MNYTKTLCNYAYMNYLIYDNQIKSQYAFLLGGDTC